MNALEARATWSLASLFVFRMLGLFMVLPVFALYAHQLRGNTAFLTGLAIGIYGTEGSVRSPRIRSRCSTVMDQEGIEFQTVRIGAV